MFTIEKVAGGIVLAGTVLTTVLMAVKNAKKWWVWLKPRVTVPSRVLRLEESVKEIHSLIEKNQEVLAKILSEVQTNGPGVSLRETIRRETESRWRYFEIDGKAVWETQLVNGEPSCVRATDALTRLVGQSPLGTNWINALHPEDADEITDAWERSIEFKIPYDKPQRFIHKDEKGKTVKTVYVRSFFRPEFDDSGEFQGGLGQCFLLTKDEWLALIEDGED